MDRWQSNVQSDYHHARSSWQTHKKPLALSEQTMTVACHPHSFNAMSPYAEMLIMAECSSKYLVAMAFKKVLGMAISQLLPISLQLTAENNKAIQFMPCMQCDQKQAVKPFHCQPEECWHPAGGLSYTLNIALS